MRESLPPARTALLWAVAAAAVAGAAAAFSAADPLGHADAETYARNAANVRADPEAFRQNFVRDHPLGNPDQVIAQTRYLAETFGASEIMFSFKYGNMPIERAERSLEMFAREALPALKEIDAAPLQPEVAQVAG